MGVLGKQTIEINKLVSNNKRSLKQVSYDRTLSLVMYIILRQLYYFPSVFEWKKLIYKVPLVLLGM